MKCSACGRSFPISSWRAVNLGAMTKSTISKPAPNRMKDVISYYSLGNRKNEYNILYACPHCGTLRIKTPIDKV